MPEPISVALVDDDPLVLRLLTDMLTASGIDVLRVTAIEDSEIVLVDAA